jgi:hypothetical protein
MNETNPLNGILITELNRAKSHNLIAYTITGDGQTLYIDFIDTAVQKANILKFQQYIIDNYNYKTLAYPDSRGLIVFNERLQK